MDLSPKEGEKKKIMQDLINVRKSIIQKYHALNAIKSSQQEKFREKYEPIIQPLNNILEENRKRPYSAAITSDNPNEDDDDEKYTYSPKEADSEETKKFQPRILLKKLPENWGSAKFSDAEMKRYYDVLLTSDSDSHYGIHLLPKSN